MLQLKNITKSYTTGDFTQVALDGISLNFRKNEFVAILGQSGSGKTTCLNMIGGLDQYDSGDLIINGKSTKDFKDGEWDAYRNNSVGFIFQSYNLIPHLSIVNNVEMGMTLSGVSTEEKQKKALEALEKVGLKDHLHKKPSQLSGGQMQRVAIARALANDPDIILADEPTGALDTATSEQIMDLIKEIAADKLVIMVTHNPELAEKHVDRIIKFQDGKVIDDSNPCELTNKDKGYQFKKTSMSFLTALKLSGKNIITKKWRTALTAFASSIGIIGIALILSLSNGFQQQIDQFQEDTLSEFPIIISPTVMNLDADAMREQQENEASIKEFPDTDSVYVTDFSENTVTHTNNITEEYLEHLDNIDPSIVNAIGHTRFVGMNLLRRVDGETTPVSMAIGMSGGMGDGGMMTSMNGAGLTSFPETIGEDSKPFLEQNYDLLAGEFPASETDLVLVVDSRNRVDFNVLKNLGFDTDDIETMKFTDIVGTELRLITNDDFFVKTEAGNFLPGTDLDGMYDSENSITLTISGVVRVNPDTAVNLLGAGIAYSDNLVQRLVDIEKNSEIVQAQKEADHNVITMEPLDADAKAQTLAHLGGSTIPNMIFIYPTDFESKSAVLDYLDDFNNDRDAADQIIYTDLGSTITEMTGGIMNAITLVLIAFASVSLIVSLIMIGIITYISVLERTKEIGVLRALGARKKDITRVFNAETFIIGTCSGLLGIAITYLLIIPVNNVIENMTDLANVAQLNPLHALMLIVISVVLTLLGGMIPARMAAKKDPVEALRAE